MDPSLLRQSPELKEEFITLAKRNLTFFVNWDHPRVSPNMLRTYSRKIPAQEALAKFCESIKRRLNIARKQCVVSQSRDTQKVKGASGEYTAANEMSRKALDKDLREQSELVFFFWWCV